MFSLAVHCVLVANKNETAMQQHLLNTGTPSASTLMHTHTRFILFIGSIMED